MTVQVLLFGPVAEAYQTSCIELEAAGATQLGDLQEALRLLRPDLEPLLRSCRWAQNQRFVSLDAAFNATDELALIPPVAGG